MCILLMSTAHPAYALVIIDNRDEFILRPTSRPHWWRANKQEILSARDLQREEQGTWLGITKHGNFAALTNYRETDANDIEHPVQGSRSRGGMVTAWLTSNENQDAGAFVERLLEGEGVKDVGGFSLLCGKLRRRKEGGRDEVTPLAIVSNRCGAAEEVPWIAERRGEVYGLSNTSYTDPVAWPKVELGKEKLSQTIDECVKESLGEDDLVRKLFDLLDTDTLPPANGQSFDKLIFQLRKSIFIPSIGDAVPPVGIPKTDTRNQADTKLSDTVEKLEEAETPNMATPPIMSGIYGTQRQTIMLVDWEGKVSFIERSLWDEYGNPIPRGEGDMKFEFQIEGWDALNNE
ncbi:hypothetical protein VC83_05287 [Pseudogymnoascus destructans]|uniref:Uncharacterized protein n=2 Tax=Pseudogymnoascus destructans TaxID=655981 RepID=L8G080_PSED2|nr:uncharacterized protein VC83_05287 [Pseudogymnoascus destructans]ELR06655.1 hypothetical protein GMDG_00272 [Pseudogymnoascus destructans 20631-21]OAF57884.1 hypothetical protein VC83_05287 [Pseudogymnoascus destructans]